MSDVLLPFVSRIAVERFWSIVGECPYDRAVKAIHWGVSNGEVQAESEDDTLYIGVEMGHQQVPIVFVVAHDKRNLGKRETVVKTTMTAQSFQSLIVTGGVKCRNLFGVHVGKSERSPIRFADALSRQAARILPEKEMSETKTSSLSANAQTRAPSQ